MKRLGLLVGVVLLAGCQQKFYRVTDNLSGKEFYMQTWRGGPLPLRGGGTSFEDIATGERVYLSTYRVVELPLSQVPRSPPAAR